MERVHEGRSRSRAQLMAMWRRQLDEQDVVPPGEPSSDVDANPVSGPSELVAKEDAKVETFAKLREADEFEMDLHSRGAKRRHGEAVQADATADGEARAGAHLRLKEQPNPQQPTQNLMATLASQRKSEVRGRRRVAKKGGAKTKTGFTHLPHQGLWKAQPVSSRVIDGGLPKNPVVGPRTFAEVAFN